MSSSTAKPPVDRHAEAIVEIQNMRETIIAQGERIEALKRELQTERDRIMILTEERARWRSDAMACRVFVTKLATIQESINRATEGAAHILEEMAVMDSTETPKESVDETTASVEAQLKKMRDIENGKTVVEAVSTGPRTDAGEHVLPQSSVDDAPLPRVRQG